MIRWGTVQKISKKEAVVILNSLRLKGKHAYQIVKVRETVPYSSSLMKNLKIGDIVAVHWKMLVKILSKEEETNLKFWTEKVLKNI